jgi:hypothetical protein
MAGSPAQLDATGTRISSGLGRIQSEAQASSSQLESNYGWIPFVGHIVHDIVKELKALVSNFIKSVKELLRMLPAIAAMWHDSGAWSDIHNGAASSAQEITAMTLHESSEWKGIAGAKYSQGVSGQAPAVSAIASLAGTVSGCCSGIGIAGIGFFVSVGVAVAMLIVGCAFGGITGGLSAIAAVIGGTLTVGGGTLALWMQAQSQERTLTGALAGNTAFTGGADGGSWPTATS